jgi:hypothetical protein
MSLLLSFVCTDYLLSGAIQRCTAQNLCRVVCGRVDIWGFLLQRFPYIAIPILRHPA